MSGALTTTEDINMILNVLGNKTIDSASLAGEQYSWFTEVLEALKGCFRESELFAYEVDKLSACGDDVEASIGGLAIAGKMGALIINTNDTDKAKGAICIEGINGYHLKPNAFLCAIVNDMTFEPDKCISRDRFHLNRMVAHVSVIKSIVYTWRALEDSESFYTPDEWKVFMQQEEFED